MPIKAPNDPNSVLIVNEQGNIKSMPSELAQDLEGTGYFVAEQEHLNLLKENNELRKFMETPGQQVASAAMGALGGLTLGVAPWAMGKTLGLIGDDDTEETFKEWLRLQDEFNPGLKLSSEVVGAIAPALLTAGGSLAVSGATGAARGASVLNAVGRGAGGLGKALSLTPTGVAVGLGRVAEEAVAKRVGESLFGTIATKATGNAVEGMAFGLGNSLSRQYLESDPNLTAEAYTLNLIKDAGIGGLVGAAVPAGLYGGTAAMREARKRIIDPLTDAIASGGKETFKKFYKPLAAWRTDSTVKEIDEMLKPLDLNMRVPVTMELAEPAAIQPPANLAGLGLPSIMTNQVDATIETKIKNTDAVLKNLFNLSEREELALKLKDDSKVGWWQKWRGEAEVKQIARKAKHYQTNLANLTDSDVNSLINRFSKEINGQIEDVPLLHRQIAQGLLQKTGGKATDFPEYQQVLSGYTEAVQNLKVQFSSKGEVNFNPKKFKEFLKNPHDPINEVEKQAYDKFNDASLNLLQTIGPDVRSMEGLTARYVIDSIELNEHITDILAKKAAWDALPIYAQRELGLTEVVAGGASLLGSMGAGIGLGPIGKAYAAARAARIGKDPAQDIAQYAKIQQGIQSIKDEVGLFGKHFAMPASVKIAEFGPAIAATTQGLQDSWDAKKRGRKRNQDELEAFQEYMTSLQGVTKEPSALQETIDRHLIGLNDLPLSRESAAQQLLITSQYLVEQIPSLRMTDDVDLDRLTVPSKDEIRKFRRIVQTINNPLKVVRDMGKGNVSLEGVSTLRRIYPRLYQDLVLEVNKLIKQGKIRSPQQREQAKLILGVGDSDLLMLQQSFEPEQPQQEPRPKGRKLGEGAVKRQIESEQTPLQKIQ